MSSNLESLDETSSISICLDQVLSWPSYSSIFVIIVTRGESQFKSMFNFFFMLGSVDYPWSYAYDELLSMLSYSRVDCLCSYACWTIIIFYSNVSMNTYFPCPRNCKTSGRKDYSRNCSNFVGFFSFLPFIGYSKKKSWNWV